MSERKRGLGRGLGALIPSGPAASAPAPERGVDKTFFPGQGASSEQPDATSNGGVITEERGLGREHDGSHARTGGGMSTSRTTPGTGASTSGTISDEGLVPVPGARFAEIDVMDIRPNPRQPRQVFDEEDLAELVYSVREVGVLQPVVVRRLPDGEADVRYELIMGERRLRAVTQAGLDRIPAIVRDTSDDNLLRDALLENLHRSQLNPLEEAAAYQQLLDDFGCTHEELAGRIGRSRPQISNTLRLLRLPPLVQRRVAAGVLSAGHARAVLGLDDPGAMERLAQRIVAEGMSVRAVEEVVALGEGTNPKPAKKRPRPGTHTSELDGLAARLGDHLETRVSIILGKNRGRLTIEFASVDDLNRILDLMTPDVPRVFER